MSKKNTRRLFHSTKHFINLADQPRLRHPTSTTMEGVSFADAEHSTPVSLNPPTILSTPTPKRKQPRKTVPSTTTKRGEAGKKGTPAGAKKDAIAPARTGGGRPVKSLPGRRKGKSAGSAAGASIVHFLNSENKMLREMTSDGQSATSRIIAVPEGFSSF